MNTTDIKKVGVVGCGIMGGGIAQVCAQSGYPTVVSEVSQEFLDRGMASIKALMAKSVDKGKMSEDEKKAALDNLKGTLTWEDFRDCDLVIEAVTENMEEKKRVFAGLDKICPENAILASNTSCLCIIEMAVQTRRHDRVLGMHFFNPVPLMRLVEIVKTIATSDASLNQAKAFGQSLGKVAVVAPDVPGFIVNRLLIPYLLDAIRMLEAGVATREDIDQGVALGLNHPMGPLTLADLIGLDTLYFIANAMYEEFKDPKYVAPPIFRKMIVAGQFGRKTGKGFYDYK